MKTKGNSTSALKFIKHSGTYPTHTQIWDVDYFRTDCCNGRAASNMVDPDGSSERCYAGTVTVGLTSTCSTQRAPAADGVTRGQTLRA